MGGGNVPGRQHPKLQPTMSQSALGLLGSVRTLAPIIVNGWFLQIAQSSPRGGEPCRQIAGANREKGRFCGLSDLRALRANENGQAERSNLQTNLIDVYSKIGTAEFTGT